MACEGCVVACIPSSEAGRGGVAAMEGRRVATPRQTRDSSSPVDMYVPVVIIIRICKALLVRELAGLSADRNNRRDDGDESVPPPLGVRCALFSVFVGVGRFSGVNKIGRLFGGASPSGFAFKLRLQASPSGLQIRQIKQISNPNQPKS